MTEQKKGIMSRFSNLSIGGKLIGLFTVLAASIILAMAIVSFLSGSSSINKEAVNKLAAVAELKTQALESFLDSRYAEVHVMTGTEMMKIDAVNVVRDIQKSQIAPNLSINQKRKILKNNSAAYRKLFQYADKYYQAIGAYAEIKFSAIYDIRNIKGEVVFKEGDQILSVNDFEGNTKNRTMYKGGLELMENKKEGAESKKFNCPFLYTSSVEHCGELKKASVHMSHPVALPGLSMSQQRNNAPVNSRFSMIMIFDLKVEVINSICNEKTGLGDSGETYLVENIGGTLKMISESRFKKGTTLKEDISSVKELQKHFKKGEFDRGAGICQNHIYPNAAGTSVLGHNHLVKIGEHTVGVITEINEDEVFNAVTRLMYIMIALGLILLIIAVIAGVFFSRSISKPIAYAVDFASKIATGDLTVDMDDQYAARGDEIGHLAQALKAMVNDLRDIISNVIRSSQNLNQAVQEIASGNETLSQRTSEQASALEEIASTIEESTATIKQNAENSQNASSLSRESLTRAEDGGKIVDNSVDAIVEINSSSKKIGEIISVINEIAFQTNLLALNASVEAARAGEQGRGFAVVAGEVRNLAQRAGNAAKEIEDLIKDSIEKVELGTDLSKQSGDALREIIERIHTVNNTISEIAAAGEEQKSGIEQINTAVIEMDTMTQQNASLVEETASASEEMSNQAQELLALVERFKLNENDSSKTSQSTSQILIHSDREKDVKPAEKDFSVKKDTSNGELKDIMNEEGFEEF